MKGDVMGFTEAQMALLDAELDPSRVAKRKGARGMTLSYIEGYDAINRMNEIFGYDGWSHSIDKIDMLFRNDETGETVFGATCSVYIIAGDEFSPQHTDVGIGTVRKPQLREITLDDIELGYKEAATDALKRAVRALGNQFGNSLYDKESPLHNAVPEPAAPKKISTTKKSEPVPVSSEFAPNLRNNVPLSDLPAPNGENGKYVCDGCGKEINKGKYLPAEIAYMSIAQSGDVRCWSCKNNSTAENKVAA